jgi:hypothetical protein
MFNWEISEKVIHTLELKIFRQNGVDSSILRNHGFLHIESCLPKLTSLWCYKNLQKTFMQLQNYFFCYTCINTTIKCLKFLWNCMLITSVNACAWYHNTLLTSTCFDHSSNRHTFCFKLKYGFAVRHIFIGKRFLGLRIIPFNLESQQWRLGVQGYLC